MRPACTVLSNIGIETVSTRRVVIVTLCDHRRLQVQVDLDAMHADVGDGAAGGDDVLAQLEGGRDADRFDGGVDAAAVGQLHHRSMALPCPVSALLTVAVAPKRRLTASRLSSRSIMMICDGE